ncbi:MAG: hypothetical protein IPI58_03270 [Alphaproteobacteria bacterium]|nr:MAG: hypothetical protein IPI58_03270 [Alphaproteobacteria bacterium]
MVNTFKSKAFVLSALSAFAIWSIIDFLVHGVLLMPSYQATAHLWRPMEEMKQAMMHLSVLLSALAFVALYAAVVSSKTLRSGLNFGALFGLSVGISMGLGTYSYMDIPFPMAMTWMCAEIVRCVSAGAAMGLIYKAVGKKA